MRSNIITFLKVIVPISIAFYIVFAVYDQLSEDEKLALFQSFKEVHYGWIVLSLVFGILSHMSRAYRWKYLQEPLGYSFNFWNAFMAVMVGYFANLALPRLGEVARCALVAKVEGKDVNKLVGTVVVERIADVLLLGFAFLIVFIFEYAVLEQLFNQLFVFLFGSTNKLTLLLYAGLLGGIVSIVTYYILKKYVPNFIQNLKGFTGRIVEGLNTFKTMKNKGYFVFHSIFIWLMYVCSIYVCFFSLSALHSLPFIAVISCFVTATFSIILVQGGIGAYPLAIMQTLVLYQIAKPLGLAIGWIIWSAQTAMIVVIGLISLILISMRTNKNKTVAYDH